MTLSDPSRAITHSTIQYTTPLSLQQSQTLHEAAIPIAVSGCASPKPCGHLATRTTTIRQTRQQREGDTRGLAARRSASCVRCSAGQPGVNGDCEAGIRGVRPRRGRGVLASRWCGEVESWRWGWAVPPILCPFEPNPRTHPSEPPTYKVQNTTPPTNSSNPSTPSTPTPAAAPPTYHTTDPAQPSARHPSIIALCSGVRSADSMRLRSRRSG